MQCTQYAIFEEVAKAQVDACIQGYNATIFAYGQTGTGKTYTMEVRACSAAISLAKRAPGAARRAEKSRRRCFSQGKGDKETQGVIPNAFEHIFESLKADMSGREYLVKARAPQSAPLACRAVSLRETRPVRIPRCRI